MSHRRLQTVAASPALRDWATSCPESAFAGTCRIETQHATYLFRNGSCFAISGRGPRAGKTSTELVGMRLAGWLLPDVDESSDAHSHGRLALGGIRVSRNWRPGSRAVLYGKAGLLAGIRLALTSPVQEFTSYGEGAGDHARPPAFDKSTTGSLTRVVAMPTPA